MNGSAGMDGDPNRRNVGRVIDTFAEPHAEIDSGPRILATQHHPVADRLDLLDIVLRQQSAHLTVEALCHVGGIAIPTLGGEGGEADEIHEQERLRPAGK